MKIVAITITLNDGFKFNEWYDHYLEYKDELYKHIIVDNGSDFEYLSHVKKMFFNSEIIERKNNGGCTIAYNEALELALSDSEIDAIMLIGNDIKLPKGNLTKLYQYLYSDERLGMVAPVLFIKNSQKIESYGNYLNFFNRMKSACNTNSELDQIDESMYVDAVPGGMNLAKRDFYEKVGLQDASLFMYCDEPDMAKRARKLGFKMGVTKNALSWHQHINPNKSVKRPIYAAYLTARNYIYLTKKHDGIFKSLFLSIYYVFLMTLHIVKNIGDKEVTDYYKASYKGVWKGFIGQMDNSFMNKS